MISRPNPTPLEHAVIAKLAAGEQPLLADLRQQLSMCCVAQRELTGVGFHTILNVPAGAQRRRGLNFRLGDVAAQIPGLKHGAGFLLYVKDGVLDMLEGYSYDESWPKEISAFELSYVPGPARDWSTLWSTLKPRGQGKSVT